MLRLIRAKYSAIDYPKNNRSFFLQQNRHNCLSQQGKMLAMKINTHVTIVIICCCDICQSSTRALEITHKNCANCPVSNQCLKFLK